LWTRSRREQELNTDCPRVWRHFRYRAGASHARGPSRGQMVLGLRHSAAALLGQTHPHVQTDLHLTTTPARPRLGTTLWETGVRAVGWVFGTTVIYPLQVLIRDGISALQTNTEWRWWRGEYERDYATFYRIRGAKSKNCARRRTGSSVVTGYRTSASLRRGLLFSTKTGHYLRSDTCEVSAKGRGWPILSLGTG
jgi:hypothetical protein